MSRHVRTTTPLTARILVTTAALLVVALPSDAHAQGLFGRIKQAAKERAASAAARAATSAVQKSGQVADTALGAGVTSVDSVSGRAVGAAATAVSRVQGLLPGALGGKSAAAAPAASNGASSTNTTNAASAAASVALPMQNVASLPLHGALFVGTADTLDTVAISYLRQLTPRLRELGGRWTVVATVTPSADKSRDQARADRRTLSVKSALIAGGMTAGDIDVLGRVAPLAPDAPVGGVILTRQR